MAYKQNSPIKQGFLNTAMSAVSNAAGMQSQTVNPYSPGTSSSTLLGMPVNNTVQAALSNQTNTTPNNIPVASPQTAASDPKIRVRNPMITQSQAVRPAVANPSMNVNQNTNNMTYDNTSSTPRPQAPINPKAFSNMSNLQSLFGGVYDRGPLQQAAIPSAPSIEVDPLTGQAMDPTASQSPTMPVVPSAGSPMSPLPPPNGVQLTTTPPLGM